MSTQSSPHALIPASLDGERLDRAVTELISGGLSRSQIAKRIREGCVLLDGEPVSRVGFRVATGQEVTLDLPTPPVFEEGQSPAILFEDETLAVIIKPSGLRMHGNHPGDLRPSVARWAQERWGETLPRESGEERPGIVHRLDRGTSGVCVLAKTSPALAHLADQFANRTVQKTYQALCYGKPRFESDWVELRLMRDPKRPERMRTTQSEGEGTRDALTYWEVLRRFAGFCHLRIQPSTGRTHQIRVHLAAMRTPIVGDPLYRVGNFGPGIHPPSWAVERMMLHAISLDFEHPTDGPVSFESPLPQEFSTCLQVLEDEFLLGEDEDS